VIATVPVAAPAVVSTIEVFCAVAVKADVALKDGTVLAMDDTVPKK